MTNPTGYGLTQFQLNSRYGTLYLILQETTPEYVGELLDLPEVKNALCLYWESHDDNWRSEDVAPKWKGIAIARELSRLAMVSLQDKNEGKALRLLELGNQIVQSFYRMTETPLLSEEGNIISP
jgi:hypothetical protein